MRTRYGMSIALTEDRPRRNMLKTFIVLVDGKTTPYQLWFGDIESGGKGPPTRGPLRRPGSYMEDDLDEWALIYGRDHLMENFGDVPEADAKRMTMELVRETEDAREERRRRDIDRWARYDEAQALTQEMVRFQDDITNKMEGRILQAIVDTLAEAGDIPEIFDHYAQFIESDVEDMIEHSWFRDLIERTAREALGDDR